MRALEAFNLDEKKWSVNVQPLSGSIANMCLFNAVCDPGDTILSLGPVSSGGHHTYGLKNESKPVNFYSKVWNMQHYEVNENYHLDYEHIRKQAIDTKPKLIIAGASTYPRDLDYKKFRAIADEVGAYLQADIAHGIGLVAAGVNNDPFPYADFVTASTSKTLRGPRAGLVYAKTEWKTKVDQSVFPGILGAPQPSLYPGLAVALKYCKTPEYRIFAEKCIENSRALCEGMDFYGYRALTGGSDTNIMVAVIQSTGINARTVLDIADEVNIIFNGVTLPTDVKSFGQGGIRLGTNVITSRGY